MTGEDLLLLLYIVNKYLSAVIARFLADRTIGHVQARGKWGGKGGNCPPIEND